MKLLDLLQRKIKKSGAKKHRTNTNPIPTSSDIITAPLLDLQQHNVISHPLHISPQQIIIGCGQSVGKQREHNEDSIVAFSLNIGSEGNTFPIGLFVIADGMGGYQDGEIASNVAVRTLTGYLLRKFQPLIANTNQTMDEPVQELMRTAIHEAQHAVLRSAPGSGTTLTAALILGQQVTIGHVGDSRAYAIRYNSKIEILTRDHSLAKRLEELGHLTSTEAAVHPQRNVLYRALGQGEILEPDVFTTQFPQPGYLLLCSDGLWGVVPDDRIPNIVNEAPTLTLACHNLISAANDAGGPDNISAILVQLIG